MVPFEPLGRSRAVSRLVVQLVVHLVVRRDPGHGRMPVEERNHVAGEQVQRLGAPHPQVIVVVADHRAGEEHEQRHRVQDRVHRPDLPVHGCQGSRDREVCERPAIRAVA